MRVCILGGGLSSLTLAKALVNQKIYVDLLDPKKNINLNKSRTLGISKKNLEFFNNYIINIEKINWKLQKIQIFSDNLKNEKLLNFENNKDQIFSIIRNYELHKILEKNLKKNKFFRKKNFNEEKNSFNNYDIIINTDYLNPITRKYFNKQIVKKYNSYAYTTIIEHQKILNNVATQIFTKKGPLAFLPISNNKTSIVYSVNSSNRINSQKIKDLIHHYNSKYKIKKFNNIDSFELKSLNLRSYHYNKFLAFGDLLHRIHPLAGQGFNMTIRDIKILLKIIESKKKLGLPLDASVNLEFEKKTRHKNFIFSNGIDFIYEFFNLERKIKNPFLSKSVQFLGNNYSINKIFKKMADEGLYF